MTAVGNSDLTYVPSKQHQQQHQGYGSSRQASSPGAMPKQATHATNSQFVDMSSGGGSGPFSTHYKMANASNGTSSGSPVILRPSSKNHSMPLLGQNHYYHTYNLSGGAHSSKTTSELLLDATHLHRYNGQQSNGNVDYRRQEGQRMSDRTGYRTNYAPSSPPNGYRSTGSKSQYASQPQPVTIVNINATLNHHNSYQEHDNNNNNYGKKADKSSSSPITSHSHSAGQASTEKSSMKPTFRLIRPNKKNNSSNQNNGNAGRVAQHHLQQQQQHQPSSSSRGKYLTKWIPHTRQKHSSSATKPASAEPQLMWTVGKADLLYTSIETCSLIMVCRSDHSTLGKRLGKLLIK